MASEPLFEKSTMVYNRAEFRPGRTGTRWIPHPSWRTLLANTVQRARDGKLVGLPVQWSTYHGKPRCVRCGAVLTPDERAVRRRVGLLRISGCVDCQERVWCVLDELEGA